ncbi:transmembrane protein 267 [Toxorhynchites rutilus septentrionalis]|uniref:transmembrane protein 267 n=1 Tax=Toxorhynchites rutilus septentrionalis TaxID=329112 RepID=UPI002478543B|nr:transmembrane protein 267 [Toxorhynchites rutilus septentrionalis]XP_055626059.1 transmembrane protein 267 [Toxorhynchites rutilus septentrionalis]XP_055626060.1 transmembrane protein 267 [Toxorhynchites rutilus septentrionalis]
MFPTLLLVKHILLLAVCLVGDKLLQVVQKPPSLKAVIDNITHAIIGLIVSEIAVRHFKDQVGRNEFYLLVGFGCLLSSWIDLDHFIEARSFHLHDATNLKNRPFLHNSMIFLVLIILTISATIAQDSLPVSLWLAVTFIAFFTHQLRDAIRRGLWFRGPYLNYNTAPVFYWVYISLIQLCPHAMIQLLNVQLQHSKIATSTGDFASKYEAFEIV